VTRSLGVCVVHRDGLGGQAGGKLRSPARIDDFILQSPNEHFAQDLGGRFNPAMEALRIDQLQQRLPGLAVAIVRRRREEHPVLAVLAKYL
jgi:hypothetical protein